MLQRHVLVAATPQSSKEIDQALRGLVHFEITNTWEDATSHLDAGRFDLVIVGYHFDELRPFRFIQYVKSDARHRNIPVLLIHALPFHLGAFDAKSVRDAYVALGAVDVISLQDLRRDHGHEMALKMFQDQVRSILGIESP
jgi:PleD family two-component response regulator